MSLLHECVAKLHEVTQDLRIESIVLISGHYHLLKSLQIVGHRLQVSIIGLGFRPDLALEKPAVLG